MSLAIVPTSLYENPGVGRENSYFVWQDLAKGNAVAPSNHVLVSHCDTFETAVPKLDILFVVDSSSSMARHQTAVAEAATKVSTLLEFWNRLACRTSDHQSLQDRLRKFLLQHNGALPGQLAFHMSHVHKQYIPSPELAR